MKRVYKKGKESPLFNDLTNKKFGKLLPLEYMLITNKNGKSQLMWKCICDCGNISYQRSTSLTNNLIIDCKKCSKIRQSEKQILPDDISKLRRIFRQYERGAYDRKLQFDISFEDFEKIIMKECVYCGEIPKTYKDGYKRNGMDRIDSKKDYLLDNVVSCCEMCNIIKRNYTEDEFFNQIIKIYKNLKLKEML